MVGHGQGGGGGGLAILQVVELIPRVRYVEVQGHVRL